MADIYINADIGNDSTGNGTSGSPYLTISKANTEASNGDTIILQASTNAYTWASLTISKSLTFQGAGIATTIIDGGGLVVGYTFNSNIVFNDLTFKNVENILYSSVFFANQNDITISFYRSNFTDIGFGSRAGVFRSSSTRKFYFESCVFDDLRMSNVTTFSGSDDGIFMCQTSSGTYELKNCTISLRTSGALKTRSVFQGIGGSVGMSLNLVNTIIDNKTGETVQFWLRDGGGTCTATVSHCCIYLITGYPSGSGVSVTATNVITSDPQLVDPANGNFNLRQGSPCIDTGTLI